MIASEPSASGGMSVESENGECIVTADEGRQIQKLQNDGHQLAIQLSDLTTLILLL